MVCTDIPKIGIVCTGCGKQGVKRMEIIADGGRKGNPLWLPTLAMPTPDSSGYGGIFPSGAWETLHARSVRGNGIGRTAAIEADSGGLPSFEK